MLKRSKYVSRLFSLWQGNRLRINVRRFNWNQVSVERVDQTILANLLISEGNFLTF